MFKIDFFCDIWNLESGLVSAKWDCRKTVNLNRRNGNIWSRLNYDILQQRFFPVYFGSVLHSLLFPQAFLLIFSMICHGISFSLQDSCSGCYQLRKSRRHVPSDVKEREKQVEWHTWRWKNYDEAWPATSWSKNNRNVDQITFERALYFSIWNREYPPARPRITTKRIKKEHVFGIVTELFSRKIPVHLHFADTSRRFGNDWN